ncbi:hypothetical protein THRCLA_22560 [Thraustotheca clavata]|uniref:Secreted protein n=1 Tax=Thraustotheca clavata TaxID=74557 RepID=A0A1V9YXA4_9STRA|nr:hypothetical protein THRCLA_22560 [Thraustotheca clavata]
MHFFKQCVVFVGLFGAINAIDGRPPCDPGVLLEKAGVSTLKSCLASANVTLDQVNQAHASAICAVPTCVTVLTQASTTTNCPQGQEFGAICNSTSNSTTTTPVATTSPLTSSTPSATTTTTSPAATTATTTTAPPSKAPVSSASAQSIAGTILVASMAVALNF